MPLHTAVLKDGTALHVPKHNQRKLAIRLLTALLEVVLDLRDQSCEIALAKLKTNAELALEPLPGLAREHKVILDHEPKAYLQELFEMLRAAIQALESRSDESFQDLFPDCSDLYQVVLGQMQRLEPLGDGYWKHGQEKTPPEAASQKRRRI